jgi:hemerythrin
MTTLTRIILDTKTVPRVDIEFMNNTHFEEIEMVKELGKLIVSYQERDTFTEGEAKQITKPLDDWLQHTQAHFERENVLMRETQFPAYPIHLAEHDIALEKMAEIINIWKNNNDIEQLEEYVFDLWPAWFDNHVNSMDMITARFAVMNGFDSQSTPHEQDLK